MTILSAIKTILEADATLLATATGGVWDWDESGAQGINRTSTTAAFDSNGVIKPCVLLKARAENPDFILRDPSNKYNSTRQVIEVWLYQDNAYSSITTMKTRIYALLAETQVTGAFWVSWAGGSGQQFDYDLRSCVEREEYLVNARRSV